MPENFILGMFLTLLVVAGIVGMLRLLYAFLCMAPLMGKSKASLSLKLDGDYDVENVVKAAAQVRELFFPGMEIQIWICESDPNLKKADFLAKKNKVDVFRVENRT